MAKNKRLSAEDYFTRAECCEKEANKMRRRGKREDARRLRKKSEKYLRAACL